MLYISFSQSTAIFAPELKYNIMGVYINYLIKNNFHDANNHEKMVEYSTKVMNKVFEEWKKLPFSDDYCYVDTDSECEGFYIGDSAPWGFWTYLHDGYWAVETTFNHYMMHWKDEEGNYAVMTFCKWLCNVLEQDEAWICLEDHLNDSSDAPEELDKWMIYAKEIGISELTTELLDEVVRNDDRAFHYREATKEHESYPIFHLSIG